MVCTIFQKGKDVREVCREFYGTAKELSCQSKESRKLIKRIKNHATKEGERLIDATLVMDPELKIDDKKFTLKFDIIMRAISDRRQLLFQYQEITSGNKKTLKRNGYIYRVSPYFVVLSGEEYFLICNPCTHDHVSHFRIEMMTNLNLWLM